MPQNGLKTDGSFVVVIVAGVDYEGVVVVVVVTAYDDDVDGKS